VAALCIPGSSHDDPNVYLQYGYHTHENTEGRWFVHQKQQEDAAGNVTLFYYDYNNVGTYGTELGRLMKVVSPSAGGAGDANRPTVQYTYNSYGQPETQTDPNGMVTKFEYYTAAQGGGLKKTIVDYGTGHLNLTAELTYDSVGRVATAKDPRGHIATNEYSDAGRLMKTTPPSPFNTSDYQTTNTYDLAGRLTFVQQGTVILQAITYNNRGQKATTRGPYPQSHTEEQYAINYTQYAYDALGRLWKVTDAEGHVTTTRYWPDGKVWKVIDAKGNNSVVNRYYGDGSLKEVEDARGNITTYEYNGFKGLARTTYEDDTYEEPTYDSYRRVHEALGRSGQVIELLYDCLNRVSTKRVWDPNSVLVNTITYQYDLMGRLYKVTDNTGTTKNTYDRAGRLIRVEYPGSKTVSYQYDASSNRTRLTYPDASYITYEYDELNRMTCVKNSSGTALASYSFDSRSRRTGLDYVNGAYADYSYDAASRLLDVDNRTQNGQHKYAYLHDKVGNRTSMMVTDSGGTRTHVYTYDNIYQITEVDYPSGFDYLATDTEFNYDAAGNRTSVIDGSGTCTYTTNALNQYTAAGSTSYQHDDSGNMVYDGTYTYGYDPENRLVLVRKSGPYGTLTLGEALDSPLTYTTGGSGNWTTINGGEGHEDLNSAYAPSLAVGQESRMQTTVEGAGTFSFWAKIDPNDANNDLKFYVDDTLRYSCGAAEWEQFSWAVTGAGTHTLKWVYRRNSQSTAGTGYVDDVGWTGTLPALPPPEPAATNWRYLTYTYDASGRRIEKKYDYETITKYVYDGDHCIAEYNAYNQLKRKYICGPAVDDPICMIDTMTSPAVTSYYHFDALGSVVTLTNSSGNTVEVYEYDVYGRPGASDANHPNRFMFTGREYDKETGLYYYRARYYNPQIGRFLQTDPVGYKAGMNWYAYCINNPLSFMDPSGLISVAFYEDDPNSQEAGFKEAADDFDIWIPLGDAYKYGFKTAGDFVLAILKSMKDNSADVTQIYFFDHGVFEKDCHAVTLGDDYYTLEGPTKEHPGDQPLQKFAEDLGTVTNEGTTLNFRGCYEGNYAGKIADWSNRTTTGFTGLVYPYVSDYGEHSADDNEYPGYDYYGSGEYIEAHPRTRTKPIPATKHRNP